MRKVLLFLGGLLLLINGLFAQSTEEVKKIAKELSSKKYYGRGYEKQGDRKAAKYIAAEMKQVGLTPVWADYYQSFTLATNTFEGNTNLTIDGKSLTPGKDFLVKKSCPSILQKMIIVEIPNEALSNPAKLREYQAMNLSGKMVVIDYDEAISRIAKHDTIAKGYFKLQTTTYVSLTDQPLRWFGIMGRSVQDRISISISKSAYKRGSKEALVEVQSTFIPNYSTSNVAGMVKGKKYPNKYVIICGHYDHLGMHGSSTYFPGADDNASGIGCIIEMARYFAKPENQPDYSIIFAAFSGEEMGLLGAGYFVENPPVALKSIVSTINLDMVGFGEKNFLAHNGENEPALMDQFEAAKGARQIDLTLTPKENINQSDHFPFTEKKIPTVFITSGVKDSPFYHSIDDTMENTTFAKAGELMKLIVAYVDSLD